VLESIKEIWSFMAWADEPDSEGAAVRVSMVGF